MKRTEWNDYHRQVSWEVERYWFGDGRGDRMEEVHCERCGATWLSPTAINMAVRHELASLVRNGKTIDFIRQLREATGLGLADAKAVLYHIVREPGKCHLCGEALSASGIVACAKCRSVNYDW